MEYSEGRITVGVHSVSNSKSNSQHAGPDREERRRKETQRRIGHWSSVGIEVQSSHNGEKVTEALCRQTPSGIAGYMALRDNVCRVLTREY